MAQQQYCFVRDGFVQAMFMLDPEVTDPEEYGNAIGGILVAQSSQLGGAWGIGDAYSDGTATVVDKPAAPPTLEERLANIESTTDWLVAVITDPGSTEETAA